MAKQDDYTRYTIRIPTPLYERVKAAAGEKSVNAEIVATLEEAYPAPTLSERQLTLAIVGNMATLASTRPEKRRPFLEALYESGELEHEVGREDLEYAHSILLKYCRVIEGREPHGFNFDDLKDMDA